MMPPDISKEELFRVLGVESLEVLQSRGPWLFVIRVPKSMDSGERRSLCDSLLAITGGCEGVIVDEDTQIEALDEAAKAHLLEVLQRG
jgi:hypothetical protein